MKIADALIHQLQRDQAHYKKTLDNRKLAGIPVGDYEETYKECCMLLNILYAVSAGKRVVIEDGRGKRK